ncbi:MAG: 30S ribosomal protein S14 [Alphaproteobacteria bacterium MarineAlpha5_Bin5]|nr:MAG: 30S ribosomal protein S14 [Alphaproteobacteria bacterium MarineAlpha5_Bin4]PPR50791.1 MAG: 30S ribosomal protein S14 [Alphaproteobacteria bacterium MarineAlpha5_Bin5]|tara:strand:- start:4483 stop:4788 length:306 start_codon:yes stop_codon:yes gene_type:complete
MAKLSSIQKNLSRSQLSKKFKNKRNKLKEKIMKKDISMEERLKLQSKLNDLPRNSSSIRYRNRCQITGRTRGVYRKFGLSRIKIRELSMSGDLPGVVKSSW